MEVKVSSLRQFSPVVSNKVCESVPVEGDPVMNLLVGPLPSHQTACSSSQFCCVTCYELLCVLTEKVQLLRPALIHADVLRELGLEPEVSGGVVHVPQDCVDSCN